MITAAVYLDLLDLLTTIERKTTSFLLPCTWYLRWCIRTMGRSSRLPPITTTANEKKLRGDGPTKPSRPCMHMAGDDMHMAADVAIAVESQHLLLVFPYQTKQWKNGKWEGKELWLLPDAKKVSFFLSSDRQKVSNHDTRNNTLSTCFVAQVSVIKSVQMLYFSLINQTKKESFYFSLKKGIFPLLQFGFTSKNVIFYVRFLVVV